MRSNQLFHTEQAGETGQIFQQGDSTAEAALQDTLTVIGRKWNPVIIYYLLVEKQLGFSDLKSRIHGISSKMLSESLSTLEDEGLVTRRVLENDPVRVRYELTEQGVALEGLISEMLSWGAGDREVM